VQERYMYVTLMQFDWTLTLGF